MAGIEKLKERILEEARQQVHENLERAEKQASEIHNAASNEAEQKKKEILEKANRDAADRKKRIIAYAELEARKYKLQAKQEVIDEAFERAVARLNSLPAEEYLKILVRMVVDSVRTGNEEIILSKKDRSLIGGKLVDNVNSSLKEKGLSDGIRLSEETRDLNGGFILRSGNVEVNNSFEAVVKMQRDRLEAEVVKVLFEEGV